MPRALSRFLCLISPVGEIPSASYLDRKLAPVFRLLDVASNSESPCQN
jgi:hypothetical protein